jgi:hypothetical protein
VGVEPGNLLRTYTGRISWFGGPTDTTGAQTTLTDPRVQGIAFDNVATKGGFWLLKMPNGVIGLVRQTDVGPAPSTGRTFDFGAALLPQLGYSGKNFPTNASISAVYVGRPSDFGGDQGKFASAVNSDLAQLSPTSQQIGAFAALGDQLQFQPGQVSAVALAPNGKLASYGTPQVASPDLANLGVANVSVPGIADWGSAIVTLVEDLTSPSFWKRVLYFVGGAVLVFFGIKELTGAQVPTVKVAR